MSSAAGASARLFGLPAVVAWSESLPFRDDAFDAVWSLGVLCTVPDKRAFLTEVRRVLGGQGALGLLVYVRTAEELPEQPEGNDFPTEEQLADDLEACGFSVVQQVSAASLGRSPQAWQDKLDRVEDVVRQQHASDSAWQEAEDQSAIIGRLIRDGHVSSVLVHAVADSVGTPV